MSSKFILYLTLLALPLIPVASKRTLPDGPYTAAVTLHSMNKQAAPASYMAKVTVENNKITSVELADQLIHKDAQAAYIYSANSLRYIETFNEETRQKQIGFTSQVRLHLSNGDTLILSVIIYPSKQILTQLL